MIDADKINEEADKRYVQYIADNGIEEATNAQ